MSVKGKAHSQDKSHQVISQHHRHLPYIPLMYQRQFLLQISIFHFSLSFDSCLRFFVMRYVLGTGRRRTKVKLVMPAATQRYSMRPLRTMNKSYFLLTCFLVTWEWEKDRCAWVCRIQFNTRVVHLHFSCYCIMMWWANNVLVPVVIRCWSRRNRGQQHRT